MRHTLYLSILVLSLVTACTKEADMNIAKESEHTVKKNLFRVTRIEGHNDHWGDYIWIINYRFRKSGSGKILRSQARAVFPARPLDRSPYSVVRKAGKRERIVFLCSVLALCAFPCGMCIYSKKCPCRTFLAFLALLKKIFLPIFVAWK